MGALRRISLLLLLAPGCAYDPFGPGGVEDDPTNDPADAGAEPDAGTPAPDAGVDALVQAACSAAQWECGTGSLRVGGVPQPVGCGDCGAGRECVAHRCRCVLAEVHDRVASPSKALADESPSLAIVAETVYAAQGTGGPSVYEFVIPPTGELSWVEPRLSPDSTIPGRFASLAVLSDGHRSLVAVDSEVGLRQVLNSTGTYAYAQTIGAWRSVQRGEVRAGPAGARRFAFAVAASGSSWTLETSSIATSALLDTLEVPGAVSAERPPFDFHFTRRPDGAERIALTDRTGGAISIAKPAAGAFTYDAVTTGAVAYTHPRLAWAPDGTGWLIARKAGDGSLAIFTRLAGDLVGWLASPMAISPFVDAGESYDLVADGTGLLHAVSVFNGQVVYGLAEPLLGAPRTVPLGEGRRPRLVVDADSNVTVVFQSADGSGLHAFSFCR